MATIPCIAVISKQNTPLHVHHPPLPIPSTSITSLLDLHLLLHSTLDVFDARLPHKTADQDFGLLFAIDERLAAYGWMTNTGVKFVVIVDQGTGGVSAGATSSALTGGSGAGSGRGGVGGAVREADLKPVFKAVHSAYIQLISNPFYDQENKMPVKSVRFKKAIQGIAESGIPGMS